MNKELSELLNRYKDKIHYSEEKYKREIFSELINVIEKHNVVLIGLRQVGKTTLMEQLAKEYEKRYLKEIEDDSEIKLSNQEDIFYLNLKALTIIDETQLINDICIHKYKLVLIDEIQVIKNWSNFLQAVIDLNPQARFIVSGSNASALKNETMVNRTKIYYINPLSFIEFKNIWNIDDIKIYLEYGSYPKSSQYNDPIIQYRELVESSIIDKILTDDVIDKKIDVSKFKSLMKNMANYIGNELTVSKLQTEQITRQTAKSYIDIFAKSQLIHLVPKYQDKNDRAKNKVYFEDKSMIKFFNNFGDLDTNSWGALIENVIFSYLFRTYSNTLRLPSIFYYRGDNEKEIDFVVEDYKILVECKYRKYIDKIQLVKELNKTIGGKFEGFKKIIVTKNDDGIIDNWEFIPLEKILRGDYGL